MGSVDLNAKKQPAVHVLCLVDPFSGGVDCFLPSLALLCPFQPLSALSGPLSAKVVTFLTISILPCTRKSFSGHSGPLLGRGTPFMWCGGGDGGGGGGRFVAWVCGACCMVCGACCVVCRSSCIMWRACGGCGLWFVVCGVPV